MAAYTTTEYYNTVNFTNTTTTNQTTRLTMHCKTIHRLMSLHVSMSCLSCSLSSDPRPSPDASSAAKIFIFRTHQRPYVNGLDLIVLC